MSYPNGKQTVPPFSRDQELTAYREMLLIRRFEEKAGQLYGMGLIGGFCHLYIGQEAGGGGHADGHPRGDQVITTYRDHGHMLACGMDPKGVMAELTGRRERLLARQGRLDAHVLQGEALLRRARHRRCQRAARSGARLRQPLSRQRQPVCLTYFGDGAANQGQVYESFNMAEAVEAPRCVHHREQQVRDGHLD
jgi:pyruvate dehydrogenase E1 component alpha subunit